MINIFYHNFTKMFHNAFYMIYSVTIRYRHDSTEYYTQFNINHYACSTARKSFSRTSEANASEFLENLE